VRIGVDDRRGSSSAAPICKKITFTGSTEVGQKLIAGAARDVKKLSLELGGNAPAIVFEDAGLAKAVEGVMLANSATLANPASPPTASTCRADLRPLRRGAGQAGESAEGRQWFGRANRTSARSSTRRVCSSQLDQIEGRQTPWRESPRRRKRIDRPGYFLEPTVLADVAGDSTCMHEEIFAPVAPIARFEKEEDAIAMANATPFGLAAYAFTSNIDRMWRVAERLEFGMIGVNDGLPTTSNAPFGGVKHSGWGRELSSEGLDAFLEIKHISIGVNA
jgi:succinate-semialdehyde dehydrogenase/glutarate-semialdehyde dehydrogenase